ncbi:unnamed protein product, partial [Musa acuminata var. zebrina]
FHASSPSRSSLLIRNLVEKALQVSNGVQDIWCGLGLSVWPGYLEPILANGCRRIFYKNLFGLQFS